MINLPQKEKRAVEAMEETFQHRFKNPMLVIRALTHASVSDNKKKRGTKGNEDYERMEFLGDRVVNLVIADLLFHAYPSEKEGDLARRHTAFVRGEALARAAKTLNVQQYLKLSASEHAAGGAENDNILADVMEALIAALYLDAGYDHVRHIVKQVVQDDIMAMSAPPIDSKTALQEWTQARQLGLPEYHLTKRDGPDHAPEFTVEVRVPLGKNTSECEVAIGIGASKRAAEKEAAQALMAKLKQNKQ
jgi:ribonuclease-3